MGHLTRAGAAAALAVLCGCATYSYHPFDPTSVESMRRTARPVLASIRLREAPRVAMEARLADERPGLKVLELGLPSAGDNGQPGGRLTARYFRRDRPGPRKLVVVLPIFGHSTFPPRRLTRHLLDNSDVDVLRIFGPGEILYWRRMAGAETEEAFLAEIDAFVARVRATVVDIRRMIEWARRQPGVDGDGVGIVGFSNSALLGSIVMGSDPRMAAGAFVVGGGHLHLVFASCGGDVQKVRDAVLPRFGWSPLEYARRLEKPLEAIDPVRYVGRIDPRRVLLLDSAKDRCIPEKARHDFYKALGHPERLSFHTSHRNTFFGMTFLAGNVIQHRILRFLEATL